MSYSHTSIFNNNRTEVEALCRIYRKLLTNSPLGLKSSVNNAAAIVKPGSTGIFLAIFSVNLLMFIFFYRGHRSRHVS